MVLTDLLKIENVMRPLIIDIVKGVQDNDAHLKDRKLDNDNLQNTNIENKTIKETPGKQLQENDATPRTSNTQTKS